MKKVVLVLFLLLLLTPRNVFALCTYYGTRFSIWSFTRTTMRWVWLALIVGVVYLLVHTIKENQDFHREPHQEDPLEILKRRYARGEISRDEYERMKKDLTE
ncbi:MAG: SHOCT domain-containing protein [Atribacterota bacterium]